MESSQKGRQGQKGQKTAPVPSSLTEGLRVWYGIWNSLVSNIPSFFSIINALGFPGFVNLVKSFPWKVANKVRKNPGLSQGPLITICNQRSLIELTYHRVSKSIVWSME